jgi:hypothetical protein
MAVIIIGDENVMFSLTFEQLQKNTVSMLTLKTDKENAK